MKERLQVAVIVAAVAGNQPDQQGRGQQAVSFHGGQQFQAFGGELALGQAVRLADKRLGVVGRMLVLSVEVGSIEGGV